MEPHVNARDDSEHLLRHASGYHAPVLWNDVIRHLVTDPSGIYVDGTLGGGGHTEALLSVLAPEGRVLAIDRDDDALAEAARRLAPALEAGRLVLIKGNFADAPQLLAERDIHQVQGLLLDLGVSSHQFDAPARGFSHRFDGPLDMRMDASMGEDAAALVNRLDIGDLIRVLSRFGEEPKAPRLAHAIAAARPIGTTAALADVVEAAAPRGQESKTLARVFQALRIAVNDELESLDRILDAAPRLVATGGRIAVISYHSLEDRRVKRILRTGNREGSLHRDLYGNAITPWEDLTRKPIVASEAEIQANPRSRSARLRVAQRRNDTEPSARHPD
ncbi:MAG: 16S rRNA (cytosine(1402)-N(4))-methyltransferase RsmH [Bacteroidetes bacterium]|nr:16S rRNA (cytosine(1402)-N(4))-methyltransferase RsmH [Bacteroidota bacterium]MDA0875180.1 16S rRNA (cytosine(1402)-N(4))-methyltransferase RsmH [Bacteroidota bacterium]